MICPCEGLSKQKQNEKNHENHTFRASLEPQGPRDPPCVKERKLLFRIALTRALYDQMAPQLCPFYILEKKTQKFLTLCFAEFGGHYGVDFMLFVMHFG